MKHLLKFMKPYLKESILGPLFKLLEVVFELSVPLVVAGIIDRGIAQGDKTFIITRCLLLAALGLVGLISAVTAQYFAARAAVGCAASMRHAMFAHIGRFSHADLDRGGTSTLITRMTGDVNQVQSGINLTLRLVLRSPFVVFGAMIMAFTVDVKASWIFVVLIPILALVIFGIMLACLPQYRRVQEKLDGLTSATRQNLTGVRVLRAFRKEADEVSAFEQKNNELTAGQTRVGRASALLNPLSYALVNIGIVLLIWAGGLRVDAGHLTQGEVIALYNYMSQILVELVKLASFIITLTRALACARRISSLLETEPTMPLPQNGATSPADPDIAVCFDHVSMQYDGAAEPALQDISFTARRGEVIGVIGGTGSGKSTLVNLIPRFYDASEGTVTVGGVAVTEWDAPALRRTVGVVPQKAVLFRGTIADNLRWSNPDATDAELARALGTAQAADVVASKQEGLCSPVEQNGRNFSGGQRQRLTIARALCGHPDILILDDSSSALDYATDAALRQALHRDCAGMTVFLVSQRATSLCHADRILVLDDGRLVGQGTHDQLLDSCETYREIYMSQFKKEGA